MRDASDSAVLVWGISRALTTVLVTHVGRGAQSALLFWLGAAEAITDPRYHAATSVAQSSPLGIPRPPFRIILTASLISCCSTLPPSCTFCWSCFRNAISSSVACSRSNVFLLSSSHKFGVDRFVHQSWSHLRNPQKAVQACLASRFLVQELAAHWTRGVAHTHNPQQICIVVLLSNSKLSSALACCQKFQVLAPPQFLFA